MKVKSTLRPNTVLRRSSTRKSQADPSLTNQEVTQGTAIASGVTQTVDEMDAKEDCDEMYDTMRVPDTQASGTFDVTVQTPLTQSFGTIMGSQHPRAKRLRPESAIP